MIKKLSSYYRAHFRLTCLQEDTQAFLLYLMSSMTMDKVYDLLYDMMLACGIDLEENSNTINNLPVSNVFLGNFWRIMALAQLMDHTEEFTLTALNTKVFQSILEKLEMARVFFKKDKHMLF